MESDTKSLFARTRGYKFHTPEENFTNNNQEIPPKDYTNIEKIIQREGSRKNSKNSKRSKNAKNQKISIQISKSRRGDDDAHSFQSIESNNLTDNPKKQNLSSNYGSVNNGNGSRYGAGRSIFGRGDGSVGKGKRSVRVKRVGIEFDRKKSRFNQLDGYDDAEVHSCKVFGKRSLESKTVFKN